MKYKLATILLVVTAVVLSTLASFSVAEPAKAAPDDPDTPGTPWPVDDPRYNPNINDNVILKWNEELLQSIRANPGATGPTVTARAVGYLHTATYDAWAAYDPVAKGTRPDGPTQRPQASNTLANKSKAISYAAYRVLLELFPWRKADFDAQMAELQFDPNDTSTDLGTPQGVGNKAAQANIDFRRNDGSNQTLNTKGTSDPADDAVTYPDSCKPACYSAKNTWNNVTDPWRWQPLCVPLPASGATSCGGSVQTPLTPHWGKVSSFALVSPMQFKVPGPPTNPDGTFSTAEIQTALNDTADLTDAEKVTAEYWADGPFTEFPPGHMSLFAQVLCRKRDQGLDHDTKLFFTLGNALLDSSIASWAHKYDPRWDFARPVTLIRHHPDFRDKTVRSWRGPYNGFDDVEGKDWMPYQAPTVVTPPFPEYVSGHSTFSGAGGYVLTAFTQSPNFGASVTIKKGSSLFERGAVPAQDVTLSWPTFNAASDEAGMSRRYGGIHFVSGDIHGRSLGDKVGRVVYSKAQNYIRGYTGY